MSGRTWVPDITQKPCSSSLNTLGWIIKPIFSIRDGVTRLPVPALDVEPQHSLRELLELDAAIPPRLHDIISLGLAALQVGMVGLGLVGGVELIKIENKMPVCVCWSACAMAMMGASCAVLAVVGIAMMRVSCVMVLVVADPWGLRSRTKPAIK